MSEQQVLPGLRHRWSDLRRDLVFLPKLDRMAVALESCDLEAVEFVRVAPTDEEVMVPAAPGVSADDVRTYPGWSAADEDQQRMWPLVGTAIEGNRVTRRCPDCNGDKRLTCTRCHGRGHVDCSFCFGSGHRSCMSCGGAGSRTVTRTNTGADGSTTTSTESQACMSCGGSGRTGCTSCLGSGRVRCHTCDGDGEVICQTCSPAGTVDVFMRRSFGESSVQTHILPVSLPGSPGPVRLGEAYVHIQPRDAGAPFDAATDRSQLAERGITAPDARIFFIRKAAVNISNVVDPRTGDLCATFIDGEPEPILTLHRTSQDPEWTPDRVRRKAWAAFMLYTLAPLVLLGLIALQQPLIGGGTAIAVVLAAYLLHHNPIQAFRITFLDVRCTRHSRAATMRCGGCAQDLCHECLQPSPRCPQCGQVASKAVTHLVEDGQWVAAQPAQQ